MLRQHNRNASPLHDHNHATKLIDRFAVQIAGRFIQHQKFWLQHTCRRKCHALLFAAGQCKYAAIHQLFQMKLRNNLLHPFPNFCRLHPAIFTRKRQLCRCIHIKILRLRVLEHAANKGHITFDRRFSGKQLPYAAAACKFPRIKRRRKSV